jgi:hypothetical protein
VDHEVEVTTHQTEAELSDRLRVASCRDVDDLHIVSHLPESVGDSVRTGNVHHRVLCAKADLQFVHPH